MKTSKVVRDINAHILDLDCKIGADGNSAIAKINFRNMAYGVITAIKFNAQGYNSFGDIIKVNNKEKFYLVIQDIRISKNGRAVDLSAILPDPSIRQLALEESQICYEDGSVVTYKGQSEVTLELEEFDTANAIECEQIAALKERFNTDIVYKPKEFKFGWVCACGCLNGCDVKYCISCSADMIEMLNACSSENMTIAIEKYKIAEEDRKEKLRIQASEKAKEKRKKNIGIAVATACVIVVVAFIVNASILSKRETYSSEEAMRLAMQGAWTHYSDYGSSPLWQTVIDGNQGTRLWSSGGAELEGEIKWNPQRGTFTFLRGTYIVNSGGRTLKEGNYEYKKGGSLSASSNSSTSTESGYSVLKITLDSVSSNGSYTICTGSVKNTGSRTYKFVEVKGSFKDADGNVVDTDWTYAVGSEGLAPDESTTFRLSVTQNSKIKSCSVSLLDFD